MNGEVGSGSLPDPENGAVLTTTPEAMTQGTSDSLRGSHARGRMLLLALAGLFALAWIGVALAPYLAVHQPLVLLALNPWPRHMLLVAPYTDMVPFVLVTSTRAFASCVIGYEIGWTYGAQGLTLLVSRAKRLGSLLRTFERVFRRAGPLFLLLSPGPLTGALAALTGMPRRRALPLLWIGQVGWVYLTYRLGDWLAPWTAPIMRFLQAYVLETTLLCVLGALAYQWIARRRRLRKLRASVAAAPQAMVPDQGQ